MELEGQRAVYMKRMRLLLLFAVLFLALLGGCNPYYYYPFDYSDYYYAPDYPEYDFYKNYYGYPYPYPYRFYFYSNYYPLLDHRYYTHRPY